ncbi:hypothetical protein PC123_g1851 [Phytophthora cactorum]|nr:hypothetical protein PC123_g1851 [Phytophthora cactorum]
MGCYNCVRRSKKWGGREGKGNGTEREVESFS